jgi:spore coat polysaccharide biosynthesis protein SpsF
VDKVVVATTFSSTPIVKYCNEHDMPFYIGIEDDILDRLFGCARAYKATHIVRVWGDGPLVSPMLIDMVLEKFHKSDRNYIYTTGWPRGMNIAVARMELIKKLHSELTDPKQREWIHTHITENPNKYNVEVLNYPVICPGYDEINYSIDTQEDLERMRKLFANWESETGS